MTQKRPSKAVESPTVGRWRYRVLAVLVLAIVYVVYSQRDAIELSPAQAQDDSPTVHNRARILRRIPHDTNHFVQGLQIVDDVLYEGTGLRGQSAMMKYAFNARLGTLDLLWRHELASDQFGEGVTVVGDTIYQLTWKAGVVNRYADGVSGPIQLDPWVNERDGWGVTWDGQHFITSDGSDTLSFRSMDDFSLVRNLRVHDSGRPVSRLNELEFINHKIWANVYMQPTIVVIDPDTGEVESVVDCRDLIEDARKSHARIDHLNGIAWDVASQSLYLTGKRWPWIYEVAVEPSDP